MKKISIFIMFICAIFLVSACSGNTEDNSQQENSPSQDTGMNAESEETITVTILDRVAGEGVQHIVFEKFIETFEAENPDIIIDNQSIMDEQSFNSRLQTMISQGNTPHIFYSLGGEGDMEYVSANIMADLSDILADDPEWANQFNEDLFSNWTFDGVDGVYGIPREPFGVGIFYNSELFEQVGVEPPTTIKELMEVSQAFLDEDIVPMALGNNDPWRAGHLMTNLVMKKYGSQKAWDLANRDANWTDPDMVEILTLMNDMREMGIFGPNVNSIDHSGEQAMFHGEESAMFMIGSWYLPDGVNSAIADKMEFVPFPYFEDVPEGADRWMGGATSGLSMSGQIEGEEREAAVRVLKALNSLEHFEAMQRESDGGYIAPFREPVLPELSPTLIEEHVESFGGASDILNEITLYDPVPQVFPQTRIELQAMFSGARSPEETAAVIEQIIRDNE